MLEMLNKQSPASTTLTKDSLYNLFEKVNPSSVSKVVDENGEPLVVYRGDNKNHTKYEWAKFIKGQSFSFYCPSTQDS